MLCVRVCRRVGSCVGVSSPPRAGPVEADAAPPAACLRTAELPRASCLTKLVFT